MPHLGAALSILKSVRDGRASKGAEEDFSTCFCTRGSDCLLHRHSKCTQLVEVLWYRGLSPKRYKELPPHARRRCNRQIWRCALARHAGKEEKWKGQQHEFSFCSGTGNKSPRCFEKALGFSPTSSRRLSHFYWSHTLFYFTQNFVSRRFGRRERSQRDKLFSSCKKHAQSISSNTMHPGTLSFDIVVSRRLMLQQIMQARRNEATFLWRHFCKFWTRVCFSWQALAVLEKKKNVEKEKEKRWGDKRTWWVYILAFHWLHYSS